MRLLLTVLSAQRGTLGERSTQAFDEAGGTLGRSASCDWTLPDAGNTLSARHAAFSHNGHGFVVTDTSTNGVYLNTVDAPLGRGQSAALSHGDTLYISDYIISVAMVKDAAPPAYRPPAPPYQPAQQPFPAGPAPGGWPLAAPAARQIDDRFGSALPDLAPFPPQPGLTPAFGQQPAPHAQPPHVATPMPQSLTAISGTPSPAPPVAPAMPAQMIPDDFDFSDLMAPPMARPAAPALTPAPWPAAASPPPAAFDTPPLAASPVSAPHQTAFGQPLPASPAVAVPPPPAPEPAAVADPLAMLRQRAIARAASIDLSRPQGEPAPAPRPAIAAVAMPGGAMPGGLGSEGGGEMAAFWTALGLDLEAIPPASRQDALSELGRALRETAAGLVAILSARKSLKDEFRIEQTRLAALENNPFKFFRSGDDALRRVIVEGKPGYLPLDRAVQQGFADIQAHEIATVVAMQNALRKLLAQMAPASIESGVEPGLLGRKPDKSRLWERYVAIHAGLAGDLDRTTREMLAEEFAKAYAEQTQNTGETGR